jgi:hypothetical protein
MKKPAAHNVPYIRENNVRLNEIAAQTAAVSIHPDEAHPIDIMISGPCPQCCGGTVHIEPVELVRHPGQAQAATGGRRQIEVICACGVQHPKPRIHRGARQVLGSSHRMGRRMTIRVAPGPAGTPESRWHSERLQELRRAELARVRHQAEQWRAGLGGFVTVVLTASLLSGRSTVSALATWTRIIVGVLMLASLLAALAGVFLSTRAANGLPSGARPQPTVSELVLEERLAARHMPPTCVRPSPQRAHRCACSSPLSASSGSGPDPRTTTSAVSNSSPTKSATTSRHPGVRIRDRASTQRGAAWGANGEQACALNGAELHSVTLNGAALTCGSHISAGQRIMPSLVHT